MSAQKRKLPKFVLGPGELETLSILTKAMSADGIVSYLLTKEIVSSKSSGEKAITTLEKKGLIQRIEEEIRVTDAGKSVQNALIVTGVIKSVARTQKRDTKEEEKSDKRE